MKCLCCGKEFTEKATAAEREQGWHRACVRRFFGVDTLPELSVSEELLERLAKESTGRGYTVPGVQKKMSLHLAAGGKEPPRLTLVNYPTGYILKPQTGEYPCLPEAEYMVMQMAQATGIRTVPFALLRTGSGGAAYITRRIDRILPHGRTKQTERLAMEDFCQLDGRLTEDKYRGSYERCARIAARYSCRKGLDLSELFLRLVFCFAVGNSDMHLKNFSLIETAPESGEYTLSAAYDLLPVNVVNPADTEQMALTLNGKKQNLHRRDFLKLADAMELPRDAALKLIAKVVSMEEKYLTLCGESYLPPELRERFAALLRERMAALRGEENA